MRSARTDPRSPATDRCRRPSASTSGRLGRCLRRGSIVWVAVSATLLLSVACGGGSVNEARLGQARDAESSPELDPQQATYTATQFFPPTPTATPGPPQPPTLESLVVALNVGAGDAPAESLASVPADSGVVYASALLNQLAAGQQIEAVWTDMFGTEVGAAEREVAVDAGQQWVSLPFEMNGRLAPGDYAVYLFADDRRLGSLVFVVGPPGSGAQAFPPPPSHPQAVSQPTQPPTGQDGRRRDGGNGGGGDFVDPGAEPVIDPNTGQPVVPTPPPG